MSKEEAGRVYYSKIEEPEKLIATVECPLRDGWHDTHYEMIARFPRFRKWWKFWEDNYEERPLKIIDLNTK